MRSPYYRPRRIGASSPHRASGKRGEAGSGCYPLLEQLGILARVTPATREAIARQVVVCASYAEAHDQLARQGLNVSMLRLVSVAVSTGQAALDLRDAALTSALTAPLPEQAMLSGLRIQVSFDGGRAKTRSPQKDGQIGANGRRPFESAWREPRVMTVHVLDKHGQMDRKRAALYEVTLADADGVFEQLAGLLRLLGAYAAEQVVFVLDGAKWMWRRLDALIAAAEIPSKRVVKVLDFYHATESIQKALQACKSLSAAQRQAEFGRLKGLLLESEDGVEQMLKALRSYARGRRSEAIKAEIAYLKPHTEHMRYATLRARNQPLGSGVVESAVRRVINLRFKSASTAWREENLEPLLYLRAILKAGHWERFLQASLRRQHWVGPTLFDPTPSCQPLQKAA